MLPDSQLKFKRRFPKVMQEDITFYEASRLSLMSKYLVGIKSPGLDSNAIFSSRKYHVLE